MKIKTNELTGPALDWAVAKCEGYIDDWNSWLHEATVKDVAESGNYHPSTDWAQGGPIIEREGITLRCGLHGWDAELEEFDAISHGPTALIAAMRCYVASKLGDEVEIPEELT